MKYFFINENLSVKDGIDLEGKRHLSVIVEQDWNSDKKPTLLKAKSNTISVAEGETSCIVTLLNPEIVCYTNDMECKEFDSMSVYFNNKLLSHYSISEDEDQLVLGGSY